MTVGFISLIFFFFLVNFLEEEKIIYLTPESSGDLHHLNYPAAPPPNVDFVLHFIAPVGYIIYLELQQVTLTENSKHCHNFLLIYIVVAGHWISY